MIKVYENSKIVVAAPANSFTGGPELLHQLVFNLRNILEIDAYMFYYSYNSINNSDPIHPMLKHYNNPFVTEIEDNSDDLLIVPEIKDGIDLLPKYKNIRKIIWWLSVDNFVKSVIINSKNRFFIMRVINKISYFLRKKPVFDIDSRCLRYTQSVLRNYKSILNTISYHLVQSYYALQFLSKQAEIPQEKIFYLSDYLNDDFLNEQFNENEKASTVVYNPRKGLGFTVKIIEYVKKCDKSIKFIPLLGMTRHEVIDTFKKAKVYIDFGNHPGKDRPPREAAILGCCVIVGKNGAAMFYEDVPINDEFKFNSFFSDIPKIYGKIKDCIDNYGQEVAKFSEYRNIIKNEKNKFLDDMKRIFIRVV